MHIAILQCENLPSFITWDIPNVDEYFEDDRSIADILRKMGHEVSLLKWSDQSISWDEFDAAVIRSTWDYIDRRNEFIDSLKKIEASGCRLFNSRNAVEWNSDKQYLLELNKAGIPIIPTYEADAIDLLELEKKFEKNNWQDAIIKPVVGGGGAGIIKSETKKINDHLQDLITQHPGTSFLIQPLMTSVMDEGEWSYVFIAGQLQYVLLKKPAAGDYRTHGIYGGSITLTKPSEEEEHQAVSIFNNIPFDTLYARLDLVKLEGQLVVMEIELIEPVLYFNLYPGAANLFADAILKRLQPEGD